MCEKNLVSKWKKYLVISGSFAEIFDKNSRGLELAESYSLTPWSQQKMISIMWKLAGNGNSFEAAVYYLIHGEQNEKWKVLQKEKKSQLFL